MDRRALLTRVTVAVGATASAVLAGCLGDGEPLDTDSASSGSGDDGDDDDDEPVETHELGDLEEIDDPDRLIVRNAGEDDREIELAVTLKTETESESEDDDDDDSDQNRNQCASDLERTLTLPPSGFLEVTIGESAGYTVTVESDGALTQSSVGHSGDSSVSRTTVEITEGGVNTRTETVSSS